MTLSPLLRWALLATLALTAVLALQPDESAATAVPVRRATNAAPSPAKPARTSPEPAWPAPPSASGTLQWSEAPRAALAAWGPPAPPPAPPVKAAPVGPVIPQAPAFPYTLIGRLEEAGVSRALLAGPVRTIDARAGDLIDGQWRVDAVLPEGVQLTWMPGGQRQTLNYRPT
jgi:hypothetical protein